jgi:ribosomal-protein-alanine N-acetyltransferase
MTYFVRRMGSGDIDGVLALERAVPEAPHWKRADYEGRTGFVADSGGRLIGFAIARLIADICELESIAVEEEARGRGIGKALFQAVVEWAESRNTARLELEVRASNQRAIAVYDKMGMRSEGVRRRYYSAPEEDAILMGMPLVPGGKPA